METKKRFENARLLKRRIASLQDEIEYWKSQAEKCTTLPTPVLSSSSSVASSPMEESVLKVIALKEQLEEVLGEQADEYLEISHLIEGLENHTERLVLRKRYLQDQSYEEIAEDTGYSTIQVHRHARRGLSRLER